MGWGVESLACIGLNILIAGTWGEGDFPFQETKERFGPSPYKAYYDPKCYLDLMVQEYQLKTTKQGTLKTSFSQ